ncbi:ribonuclease E/G [Pararhizobium haloflavum]|uniref:ribonuclease E/G n=1 Tax=Pararhizobium haloflavum TaxID=2037914 RepID=UPI000C19C6ED|nr:ribonuclease E/G [Pararhizobium haloflavum]
MADKMLIDASHEEETRVVVVRGNRIEEFDFESQHKKQLRGNIYLAKVTRVEPSLQAAFVDYGGNRHGFLAFSEIHPDYYQIPLADRQALLAAEAEAEAERARSENDEDDDVEAPAAAGESAEEPDEETPARAARGKSKPKRSRKPRKKSDNEELEGAVKDLEASSDDDADGADGGNSGSDDESGGTGGRGEMAAMVETESVSEPAPGIDGDDEERDPGEVDLEAAKHVEGKASQQTVAVTRQSDEDDDASDADDDDSAEERSGNRRKSRRRGRNEDQDDEQNGKVESVGAEDALEEVPDRSVARKPRKQYRIQEVIKRRQILLVQVVKEERGNKGAALTTYLSLAGRYSVLMPNTARGGGISRKITNVADRKRLKEIAKGLEVPQGMGVILRTAGANRTKAEVKRDFEYLMRLWENVRNLTLASTAPCLVYEEGSLIKRSIRDLYNKDISEVIVSGEEGYREAKDFMKMLMPSHAKVVQPYREVHPIFSRSGIEAQLDRMLQPQVTLKSGGYIIINQTEALVAIDVNSGRSTKEHSIEDTALQTNLEAADEVARQLRLRDLAGLIVVDFIDMEEKRNNRSVEKRLKDALKNDRARIQVGRISHFGLLEMSRQRIRASVLESTTQVCEHCGGTGHVRSQSSVALHVIRSIEEYLLKSTTHNITVRTTPDTALYVLNHKRETIVEMERRFGVSVVIEADNTIGSAHLAIDRGTAVETPVKIADIVNVDIEPEDDAGPEPSWDEDDEAEGTAPARARVSDGDGESEEDNDGDPRRRKRRRRRRGGRDRNRDGDAPQSAKGDSDDDSDDGENGDRTQMDGGEDDGDKPRKRRRRGKRGGRRNRNGDEGAASEESNDTTADDQPVAASATEAADDATARAEPAVEQAPAADSNADAPESAAAASQPSESVSATPADTDGVEEKPKRKRAPRRKKSEPVEEAAKAPQASASEEQAEAPVVAAEPADAPQEAESAQPDPVVVSNGTEASDDEEAAAPKKKKAGWWQRRGFF